MKLNERMKQYEVVAGTLLMPRTPVIIRIDGKAFHTWTKSLNRPFDDSFTSWMANTMKSLVDNIQNAVFGYCQSDEISILLRDYDNLNSEQWFNGKVQKIVSVSSSIATAHFNYYVSDAGEEYSDMPLALFDARVFNLPTDEVTNYFIWRQQDCIRNSIQALAHKVIGHAQCQNKNTLKLVELMSMEHGVSWGELPYHHKHGTTYDIRSRESNVRIPIFTELREFIDIHVHNT